MVKKIMAVDVRTKFILANKAGGICSFPDCHEELIADATDTDDFVVLGEIAHIVAQKKDGPRGKSPYPRDKIDSYDNLLLLCEKHHKLIDGQPQTYTVEKIRQMKEEHERWVAERLSKDKKFQHVHEPHQHVTDIVHSTLLPVTKIPLYVFRAPCTIKEDELAEHIDYPQKRSVMLPYIVREGFLITFTDLREVRNPFSKVIDQNDVRRAHARDWWRDPDKFRWYMTLLNRSLNKLTGRKGLNLDKEHSRYYFEPEEKGQVKTVTYQTLGKRKSSRQVAWRPEFRYKEGYKNYWEHLAVGLRFHYVDTLSWCLSVRPERRFTRDGYESLTPKGTGSRSTSRKSHMYNIDVLEEVHFWREFLSGGSPRIVMNFGKQSIIIDNEMLSAEITWPGVPNDAKAMKNIRHDDDLFSYIEYHALLEADEEFDEWEEEDFEWDTGEEDDERE